MNNQIRYQFSPIPFTDVTFTDRFWRTRLETNRTVTIPYDFHKCEETGRIDNFAKAAGLMPGDHEGIFYNDSDVFKIIEGAAFSLNLHPDPKLDSYLDGLIAKIAAAQEEDGYLYTPRTIAQRTGKVENLSPQREGATRWSNLRVNHELYNVGHMYEAAVAHFRATGKRTLLDIAIKNANLIGHVFGPEGRHDVPGHQEIEIGLVKLYHVTGDVKYLQLAKFFLDERGHAHGRDLYTNFGIPGYMQDHLPVTEQTKAVGHAVRAVYMYCAMADVATLTAAQEYVTAIDTIWNDVVTSKIYITGGIGARHSGESFGEAYELPNDTAYAETCAAIASAMWNHRMFLLHGDAKYIDVVERTIYNGFLSGISLSGDLFFYVNPLAFDGEYHFNRNTTTREPWFDCSCCPSNVVRFLPSLPGYVYAKGPEGIFVNLFVEGTADVELDGTDVRIRQETEYPWDGQVSMSLSLRQPASFTLHVRIPGWARNQPLPGDLYRYLDPEPPAPELRVNGSATPLNVHNGYARINRTWTDGDRAELTLPMPVRRLVSHANSVNNFGRVALERGPIVYCAEWVDNDPEVSQLVLPDHVAVDTERRPDMFDGVTVLCAKSDGLDFTAIPYYAWGHRGSRRNGCVASAPTSVEPHGSFQAERVSCRNSAETMSPVTVDARFLSGSNAVTTGNLGEPTHEEDSMGNHRLR